MLKSFLRHYLELPEAPKKVVCLGGGVGTAQILKGLRGSFDLTAIISMADDGGSAGRLRRAFSVPPPGDLVNCLAALSDEESILKKLFMYRFAGKRYGRDTDLGGHKLGNLIFVALADIYKGDTGKALEKFSEIIASKGRVLPATIGDVNIWALTEDGQKVYGEENIDLGKYTGTSKTLKEVHLDPPNPKVYKPAIEAIKNAQVIITGPGDLFSTILPVLIIPQIKDEIIKSKALKIFIVNIANKPFETKGYKVSDYLKTIRKHTESLTFDTILVNSNQKLPIPKNLDYHYVRFDKESAHQTKEQFIESDLVSSVFPIYHDSKKIAKKIFNLIYS